MAQVGGVADVGALQLGRAPITMTDANIILTQAQYENSCLEMGVGVTLTAGRNVTLPLIDGMLWSVFNGTTGGFALTFIGASGTGIAVAAGKRAFLMTDGVNVNRLSADV